MNIIFPTKDQLEAWQQLILQYAIKYIPPMSQKWVEHMYSAFEVVKLSPDNQDSFACAASRLLFKIAKNHREPDGNKRSAILCLYFFILLNQKRLDMSADLLEFIALLTAGHPREAEDFVLSLIETTFEERIRDR